MKSPSTWPATIVVGVDLSPESRAALEHAAVLGARTGATVVTVHAVGLLEASGARPHVDVAALVADVAAALGENAGGLAPPVIEDGPAADVVVRVADRLEADLIVVGRRGLDDATAPLGSTSTKLVERARHPVLVVTADG
ncbi:universal stress protein [Desertimonas flava]|uniref:universal stress protein n=1 Tax=Desertimonas flava TaxID=2064846 RepID=UPI000E34F756|nr:universal stress protein [Desertimonas flava]